MHLAPGYSSSKSFLCLYLNTVTSFGALFFLFLGSLFASHSVYLPLFGFPINQNVQDGSFRACPKLAAHGSAVTHILGMCFDSLDDGELVDELLSKLVVSHVRRGIEPSMFEHIVTPFTDALTSSGTFSPTEMAILQAAFLHVKERIQWLYGEVDANELFDDDSADSVTDN